jgi:mannose-6-phosphate isomerase-like protein (cupin superfamily)
MSILDNVKTQGPWRNAARKRWKQLCLAGWIASFTVAAHGQTSANTSAEQKPSAKVFYVAKPIHPAPYLAPMKPLVHLADLKQKHKGEVNWTELVVYDKNNRAEVTSAAPGSKLPRQLHSDAPEYWVVLEGRIRFEVEDPPGKFQTFEAGKGDLVLAPERHLFSLEVVGSEPAIRLAVTLPDTSTIYETRPQHAEKGTEYIPVTLFTGDNPDDVPNDGKPDRLFFNIDELQKEHPGHRSSSGSSKGSWSDLAVRKNRAHANIICGYAADVKHIAGDLGHYHTDFAEIWTIMRGQQSFSIEGIKPFVASEGDIVYAPAKRWHLIEAAGEGISCRLAMTPYPNGNHLYQPRQQ